MSNAAVALPPLAIANDELAHEHVAIFAHVETDDEGEPRLVTSTAQFSGQATTKHALPRAAHVPRLRVVTVIDEMPHIRRAIFRQNPFCIECDDRIATADEGGVIPTDEGPRLAHRADCFARAIAKHQPHLAFSAAVGRASRR